MRPKSIMLFERLYLAAIAIEVVRVAIDWPLLLQSSALDQWVRVASIIVSLLLVFLASHWLGRIAGLILAALFVIGLPMIATILQPGTDLATAVATGLQVLLQAAALVFLFRPESRAWFNGGPEVTAA